MKYGIIKKTGVCSDIQSCLFMMFCIETKEPAPEACRILGAYAARAVKKMPFRQSVRKRGEEKSD